MVQAEFIRDLHSNHMVIKGVEGSDSYKSKMLIHNQIPGILKCELRWIDQTELLYFNITAKKSLYMIYENSTFQLDELVRILHSLFKTIEISGDYLLSENDFIIDPNYIYLDNKSREVELCHLAGYGQDIKEQISSFIEYLMNKVDYKEESAVLLVYALYKESKEADCTLPGLMEKLNQYNEQEQQTIENRILSGSNKTSEAGMNRSKVSSSDESGMSDKASDLNRSFNTYKEQAGRQIKPVSEKRLENPHMRSKGFLSVKGLTAQHGNVLAGDTNNRIITRLDRIKSGFTKENRKCHHSKENGNDKVSRKRVTDLGLEIENDKEELFYSNYTYIVTAVSVLGGVILFVLAIKAGILTNSLRTGIDMVKLLSCVFIIGCLEAYLLSKLFDPKRKQSRMVTDIDYLEADQEEGGFHGASAGNVRFWESSNTQKEEEAAYQNQSPGFYEDLKVERDENTDRQDNCGFINEKEVTASNKRKESNTHSNRNQVHKEEDLSTYNTEETENVQENGYQHDEQTQILWKEEMQSDEDKTVVLKVLPQKEYYLELISPDKRTIIPVEVFPFLIGKSDRNVNLNINDKSVSRKHAHIIKEGEDIYLIDLGSTNGTFLNGLKLTRHKPYPIFEQDEIVISQVKYYWRINEF